MTVTQIRHAWPEPAGFLIRRPVGRPDYTFLHFFNGVEILIGDRTVMAPPHTCLIYAPGTPQYFYSRTPLTHDWFHLSEDAAPLFSQTGFPTDTLLHPLRTDFITEIVRETENEFFSQKSGRDLMMRLKIEELLLKIRRSSGGEDPPPIGDSVEERLRGLRSEVFSSLNRPWTVAEMAARVGFSSSRFYSVYRSFFGNSPIDDLIRARIDAAKNALCFGDQSVTAIADSLGYKNLTHFMRQFRRATGLTPKSFRALNR